MKLETFTYLCDKCGKQLKTCNNHLDIASFLNESTCWSRLHIQVIYHSIAIVYRTHIIDIRP